MCSCLHPVHPRLGCCLPAGLWKIIPPSPGQLESALFAEASDGCMGATCGPLGSPWDPSGFSKVTGRTSLLSGSAVGRLVRKTDGF